MGGVEGEVKGTLYLGVEGVSTLYLAWMGLMERLPVTMLPRLLVSLELSTGGYKFLILENQSLNQRLSLKGLFLENLPFNTPQDRFYRSNI